MTEFKVGDWVQRTKNFKEYGVGDQPFKVRSVTPSGQWIEDEYNQSHYLENLRAAGGTVLGDKPHLHVEQKPNGEVRTTSSTGGEKGVKPEAYALIPWEAMDEVARVYEFGARKYADHNWRKGYQWSKSFSALCRHIFAFWRGEDRDPESNLSHLAHAAFHVLGILTWWLEGARYTQHDDRYKPEAEKPKFATGGIVKGSPYPHVHIDSGFDPLTTIRHGQTIGVMGGTVHN